MSVCRHVDALQTFIHMLFLHMYIYLYIGMYIIYVGFLMLDVNGWFWEYKFYNWFQKPWNRCDDHRTYNYIQRWHCLKPGANPTILRSYDPTILRSYDPTILRSYDPTILRSRVTTPASKFLQCHG
jgi:hypothetical protein